MADLDTRMREAAFSRATLAIEETIWAYAGDSDEVDRDERIVGVVADLVDDMIGYLVEATRQADAL